jgi:hypothetical protein
MAILRVTAMCSQALRVQQTTLPVIGFVSSASRESTLGARLTSHPVLR